MDEILQAILGVIIVIGILLAMWIVGHPDLSRYPECVKYEDKVVRTETETWLEVIPLVGQRIRDSVMLEDDSVKWVLVSPEALKTLFVSRVKPHISFILLNKTNTPLTINWEASAYIIGGVSSRLIHSGIKFIDAEKKQEPTLVPPKASIIETVVPVSLIERVGFDWHIQDITSATNIELYLTLEGEGIGKKSYSFRWNIEEHQRTIEKKGKVCVEWREPAKK